MGRRGVGSRASLGWESVLQRSRERWTLRKRWAMSLLKSGCCSRILVASTSTVYRSSDAVAKLRARPGRQGPPARLGLLGRGPAVATHREGWHNGEHEVEGSVAGRCCIHGIPRVRGFAGDTTAGNRPDAETAAAAPGRAAAGRAGPSRALALIVFHYVPLLGNVIAFQDYQPYLGHRRARWVGLRQLPVICRRRPGVPERAQEHADHHRCPDRSSSSRCRSRWRCCWTA